MRMDARRRESTNRVGGPLGDRVELMGGVEIGADDDELVAAEAGHQIAVTNVRLQGGCHTHHQSVALGVAESVIDVLEVVQVAVEDTEAVGRVPSRRSDSARYSSSRFNSPVIGSRRARSCSCSSARPRRVSWT